MCNIYSNTHHIWSVHLPNVSETNDSFNNNYNCVNQQFFFFTLFCRFVVVVIIVLYLFCVSFNYFIHFNDICNQTNFNTLLKRVNNFMANRYIHRHIQFIMDMYVSFCKVGRITECPLASFSLFASIYCCCLVLYLKLLHTMMLIKLVCKNI